MQPAGGLPAVRGEGDEFLVVSGVRFFDDLPAADVEADVSGVAVADLGEDEVTRGRPVLGSTVTEWYMSSAVRMVRARRSSPAAA